jgi:hypothetical protein
MTASLPILLLGRRGGGFCPISRVEGSPPEALGTVLEPL